MYFQTTNVTDSTVTMRLNAANGGHLDFIYKLLPNSLRCRLYCPGKRIANFLSPSVKTMSVDWKQRARQMEKDIRTALYFAYL